VDKNKTYRIATLDYLAEGNDKLEVFKSKTDVKSPKGKESTVRAFIIKYFKSMAAEGKAVDAQVEGRFVKEK
jgi:2',3'-cyclic-nucleotide 2'-phosphodiesterase (5'-nucleotidase family)